MLFLLFYYYSLVQDIFYSIYEIHLALTTVDGVIPLLVYQQMNH